MSKPNRIPSVTLRIQVIVAIDYAQGNSLRERIRTVSKQEFLDPQTGCTHKFTWRTIETWRYLYKKNGVQGLENKSRSDKNKQRKVSIAELAEAINEVTPFLSKNKVGHIPKSTLYRYLLEKKYFIKQQISPSTFYRFVKEHDLLNSKATEKMRSCFSMQHTNELWQGDTMYGPSIMQNGKWKKTFFIAFIDDASRVITHGEFFYQDNTENMIEAFRTALYKRGKPERLYFDNGSNYTSKEILQSCLRLNIIVAHAPVRDGAAKGKIERFFRGFRDRFLVMHTKFDSLAHLNELAQDWIENQYNNQLHTGIQMRPLDRFNMDFDRIQYLANDEYTDEVFFVEEDRTVSKVNTISIKNKKYECPVDLRGKTIQVRFNRTKMNKFIIYYKEQRMGQATLLNAILNSNHRRDS
jgi:hypothetical protein